MATRIGFSPNLFEATDDECLVASILLELRSSTKAESDPVPGFPLSWGAKKRRRFTDETPSQRLLPSTSPPPPLPPPLPTLTPSLQGPGLSDAVKAGAASSPATPLAFSPSESDDSLKSLKRKFCETKTKGELLDSIGKITKSNTWFETEIEKLKSYHEGLKAKNLWLKARKQELSFNNRIEKPSHLEASNSNCTDLRFEMRVGRTTVKSTTPIGNQVHHFSHLPRITVHQSSLIVNQTATEPESTYYYYPQQCGRMLSSYTSGGGLGKSIDDVGPAGIPDLNLSPADSFWMDSNPPSSVDNKSFSRAMAAQARHRRMQICRDKNSSAANRLRISFR